MKKFFISSAYIYPVCPLNVNHAKMFVVADVFARYQRSKGNDVFFPIASHYSGNTAHKIAKTFQDIYANKGKKSKEEEKIWQLYKKVYSAPESILPTFTEPLNILDFYTQEILWELKSLDVSGDYKAFYTTKQEDFISFIQTILSLYEEHGFMIENREGKLALNYESKTWKKQVSTQLKRTKFTKNSQKNNVFSALNNNNLRNDWSFIRDNGFGVPYKNKWIIDPMFDSELFTIFDIYAKFANIADSNNKDKIFRGIFKVLQGQKAPSTELEKRIVEWLPCDLFVCEEHLKNWILKKFYAENALLDSQYHTKHYFVLGMGLLKGDRMSASRGNAVLASDIVNQYGPTKSRLIILMQGGHPSKTYNYNEHIINEIDSLLSIFTNYYTYLLITAKNEQKEFNDDFSEKELRKRLDDALDKGYFKQALLELLSVIPKEYSQIKSAKTAQTLIVFYQEYLDILAPSLLKGFNTSN